MKGLKKLVRFGTGFWFETCIEKLTRSKNISRTKKPNHSRYSARVPHMFLGHSIRPSMHVPVGRPVLCPPRYIPHQAPDIIMLSTFQHLILEFICHSDLTSVYRILKSPSSTFCEDSKSKILTQWLTQSRLWLFVNTRT